MARQSVNVLDFIVNELEKRSGALWQATRSGLTRAGESFATHVGQPLGRWATKPLAKQLIAKSAPPALGYGIDKGLEKWNPTLPEGMWGTEKWDPATDTMQQKSLSDVLPPKTFTFLGGLYSAHNILGSAAKGLRNTSWGQAGAKMTPGPATMTPGPFGVSNVTPGPMMPTGLFGASWKGTPTRALANTLQATPTVAVGGLGLPLLAGHAHQQGVGYATDRFNTLSAGKRGDPGTPLREQQDKLTDYHLHKRYAEMTPAEQKQFVLSKGVDKWPADQPEPGDPNFVGPPAEPSATGGPKTPPPPPNTSFLSDVPNWGKGLGVLGAGLGAHMIGSSMSGEEWDPETGEPKKKHPWLGPLLGAGALGAGAYMLKGDRPWGDMIKPEFWQEKGGAYKPLVLVPYQVKNAFGEPPPEPTPDYTQLPAPDYTKPAPPINKAAPPPPVPPPAPVPPAAPPKVGPSTKPGVRMYDPANRPSAFNPEYGIKPSTPQTQAVGQVAALLGGGTTPGIAGLGAIPAASQASQTPTIGAGRPDTFAAGGIGQNAMQWQQQQQAQAAYMKANPTWKAPEGATGEAAAPWLTGALKGQQDQLARFKGMSQADKEHGYGMVREHTPGAAGAYSAATGYKPTEVEEDDPILQGLDQSKGLRDEITGRDARVVPKGTQMRDRLAIRAAQQVPEAKDQNVQLNKIREGVIQSGEHGPGLMDKVMAIWKGMDTGTRILVGAGLSLGAVGLIGMLSGSETFGGGTGALMGLGGLAAAAYGSGAFDSTSPLRKMFSGEFQREHQEGILPQVPQSLQKYDARSLSLGGFDANKIQKMISDAQQGIDPTNGERVGPEAANQQLTHFFAGHSADAQQSVMGQFQNNPQVQKQIQDMYQKSVPSYQQWHQGTQQAAQAAFDPQGQLFPVKAIEQNGQITDMRQLAQDPKLAPFIAAGPKGMEFTDQGKQFIMNPGNDAQIQQLYGRLSPELRQQFQGQAAKAHADLERYKATPGWQRTAGRLTGDVPGWLTDENLPQLEQRLQQLHGMMGQMDAGGGGANPDGSITKASPAQGGAGAAPFPQSDEVAQLKQLGNQFNSAPDSASEPGEPPTEGSFQELQMRFAGAPENHQVALIKHLDEVAQTPIDTRDPQHAELIQTERERAWRRADSLRNVMVASQMGRIFKDGPAAQEATLANSDTRSLGILAHRMQQMLGDGPKMQEYGITAATFPAVQAFAQKAQHTMLSRLATEPFTESTAQGILNVYQDPTMSPDRKVNFFNNLPPERKQAVHSWIEKSIGGQQASDVDKLQEGLGYTDMGRERARQQAAIRQLTHIYGGRPGDPLNPKWEQFKRLSTALGVLNPDKDFPTTGIPANARDMISQYRGLVGPMAEQRLPGSKPTDAKLPLTDIELIQLAQGLRTGGSNSALALADRNMQALAMTPEEKATLLAQKRRPYTIPAFTANAYRIPSQGMMEGLPYTRDPKWPKPKPYENYGLRDYLANPNNSSSDYAGADAY